MLWHQRAKKTTALIDYVTDGVTPTSEIQETFTKKFCFRTYFSMHNHSFSVDRQFLLLQDIC